MGQFAPMFAASCIASPVNKANAKMLVLSAAQSVSLGAALIDDSKGSIYSAMVSIADAFAGLQRGCFSWATVKLYYACFYLAKAALARRGFCVFYIGRSPHYLEAKAGSAPISQAGNSHTVITSLYKSYISHGIINAQPINGIHAFDWMAERREDVNYKDLRLSDPLVPKWLASVDKLGLRRTLGDYLADPSLYAFDESHALVALPLAALLDEFKSSVGFIGLGLNGNDIAYLKGALSDKNGPIHHFSFLQNI